MASGRCRFLRRRVRPFWKPIVVVAAPLLFLPLSLNGTPEGRAGYVMLVMAAFWMTEALPIAVTSLIPIVALPLLDVVDTERVCGQYFNKTTALVLANLIVAGAVEYSGLHLRIALRAVLVFGADPKKLMLGLMLVTAFLSMWITNATVVSMVIPVVHVLDEQLFRDDGDAAATEGLADGDRADEEAGANPTGRQRRDDRRLVRAKLFLAVAYAANIGGNGTLVGCGSSLMLKGLLDERYGDRLDLGMANFMAMNVPVIVVVLLLLWLYTSSFRFDGRKDGEVVRRAVLDKYRALGPITFHQLTVMLLFFLLINLWIWRNPKHVPGWGAFFDKQIGDAVAALLIVLVLFTLPVKFDACCSDDVDGEPHVVKAMLDWPTVQRRLAWDILLLVGGGFALSDGAKASGLDVWIGHRLTALEQLPPLAISFVACVFIGCLTEVVANNAAASVTLPILAQMAEKIRVNPIYLTMPAAAACNFVSIFPVGSPCLLMAFSAARVKPMEMVKDGLVAKVICVATFCLAMEAFGSVVFLDPIDPTTSGANSSSTTFHDGSRTDVF